MSTRCHILGSETQIKHDSCLQKNVWLFSSPVGTGVDPRAVRTGLGVTNYLISLTEFESNEWNTYHASFLSGIRF